MRKLINTVRDESRSVHERMFILLAVIALTAMFFVFVVGFLIKEDPVSTIAVGTGFAVFLLIAVIGIKTKKINAAAAIIATLLILGLLPLTFFANGGIHGGSPLWFVFCTLFVSMIVYGRLKYFFLFLEAAAAAACYFLAYKFPQLLSEHRLKTAYIDSYVSMVFVGIMLSLMVGFEIMMLKKEKERSEAKSREIEELNKSQSRFFSSMSHEIRTPINTIIGLNEMILREDISEEVADDARNIQSASGILLSLINDILDMSKMESGRMEIIPVIYDVRKMLSEIEGMISVSAAGKGLEFNIEADPSMPSQLLSDEVRIRQILINLLNNAVKYTNTGSVSLSVHCRRTASNKAMVTYSVEDTGIGIRKENIPHLFDAFKRVDEKRNRFIEGTGLGLSIVKQLSDLLGGEVSVNSIYTHGSTFVFTLEQEIADETPLGELTASFSRSSGGRSGTHSFEAPKARVLIVDDNSANLLVTEKLLRRTKVITETAESGEACLKLTVQKHFDAVLMDHMMPDMDGIECMHAMRSQTGGLNRDTPVIVLTANAGSENRALYSREGFDGYLLKPVDPEAMEEALVGVLPSEMVKLKGISADLSKSGSVRAAKRKVPLLITTDSVSDLPRSLIEKLGIPVIPYKVYTDSGVFDDRLEADGDMIIRCMQDEGMKARSECPSVEEYEKFFAEQLLYAQHIIHIAMARRSSGGFDNATEAALAFYNVTVVDSGHLSSGMGLMVLLTVMRMKNEPFASPEDILQGVELLKNEINTSFILENTEYLCRSGRLSERVSRLCTAFMIHPMIVMKNSSMTVGKIFFGSLKKARRAYIKRELRDPSGIDTDVLFITYAGMKHEEIEEIKQTVLEFVKFENIYLQKASPAISANCGAGTFGLLFRRK